MTINKDMGFHVYQSEFGIQAVSYKQSVRCDEEVVLRVEQCATSNFINRLLLYDWLNRVR